MPAVSNVGSTPAPQQSQPPATGPGSIASDASGAGLEIQLAALRDLRWASWASAAVALELLALTLPEVFIPGAGFTANFSVQAAYAAPPPWNQILFAASPASSAASWAIVIPLILIGIVLGGIAFGYLVGAYRLLRRAGTESLLPEAKPFGLVQGCLALAGVMVLLYLVTLGLTFAFLSAPPAGPTSPQGFVVGVQQGLGIAGAFLALWLVLFIVLVTTAYQVLSEIAAPWGDRLATRRALDLMIVGSLFYFGIVATPFWNPTPFTATLEFFGSHSPEMVLLTLPTWLVLSAGALLLVKAYGRDLAHAPPRTARSHAEISGSSTAEGPAETGAANAPSTPARKPAASLLRGRAIVWGMAIGVALLVYTAPSAGSSFGELGHWSCAPGTLVANESVWYPQVIINAPYGGNASGTLADIDSNGNGWSTLTTEATNGTTTVIAVFDYWNIYTARAVLLPGAGADMACSGSFLAQAGFGGYGRSFATFTLDKPSNETDRGLPTNLSGGVPTHGGSEFVVFNASYTIPSMLPYENCAGSPGAPMQWTAYSESVKFQIPFSWNGKPELVGVSMYALTNYTYSTAASGVFNVENLAGEPHTFGSGLAFDRQPCP